MFDLGSYSKWVFICVDGDDVSFYNGGKPLTKEEKRISSELMTEMDQWRQLHG